MAVKRRIIECECGATFVENRDGLLEGNLAWSPWKHKNHRIRSTKSPSGGDIIVVVFIRSVHCKKCKSELLREKKEYEISPAARNDELETSNSCISKELLLK